MWQAAQQAFKKVRASFTDTALKYLDKMAGRLHHTGIPGDYAEKAELIDQLTMAVEDSRVTFVNYQSLSATEPVEYELEPLGLVYHRGAIYLVATSRGHGELRHFKIDRITSVAVEAFKFERPADFDLSTHLAGSFGVFQGKDDIPVRVRFLPSVVRYVQEKRWHASEEREPQRDGSLVVRYRLSSVEELKRWLLSFGRHAEVLDPPSLRRDMEDEARALTALYARAESNGDAQARVSTKARTTKGTGRASPGGKTKRIRKAR
jgi:predicted DNA-binding transcriptional regulator YafY